MEDLQLHKSFKVKTNILTEGEYWVHYSTHDIPFEEASVYLIDKTILHIYGSSILRNIPISSIIKIDASEKNKNVFYSLKIINKLLQLGVTKKTNLIAIGGGITQDIVGFIADNLFRGCIWHFYPTSLLAQCDSCIGSKSSINHLEYKNLIGGFYPPQKIVIIPKFLESLTDGEIRSGIGEMLHYFLQSDIELAEKLITNIDNVLVLNNIQYYIDNSLKIKKQVIEIDEFDKGLRHLFNYGHTFGHAIESVTNFEIKHGIAVSIGMDLANFISLKLNLITPKIYERYANILTRNFPSSFPEIDLNEYINALKKDKKNIPGKLGCILLTDINKVEKRFLDFDDNLIALLSQYFKLYEKKDSGNKFLWLHAQAARGI